MNNIFLILAIISLAAVIISLALGVLGMIRSSEFNKRYGNLFMRLRIISQICVVIFLILFFVTR
ncbi:MAG: hypothetical protein CMM49_08555 [Rhodospirillaceae bacterium]|nr:hypothetical protein [Rhodospirillaceae bacterium]